MLKLPTTPMQCKILWMLNVSERDFKVTNLVTRT